MTGQHSRKKNLNLMDLYQSWDQPGYIISILKGLEAYLFFQGLTFYNIHVGTLAANIHVEKKTLLLSSWRYMRYKLLSIPNF
jgi:hypothetical protein